MTTAPQDVPLDRLLTFSPYLRDLAERHADWFEGARAAPPDAGLATELAELRQAVDAAGEDEMGKIMRRAKGRLALLAAFAEVTGTWTTAQATAALSDLADAALDAGLAVLLRLAAERGQLDPVPTDRCGLALFALGKHGGRELNYSSDIDIVAFFDPQRATLKEPAEATRTYSKIVQKLAGLMQDRTAAGYVFRTDLRLRPDPGSTPVAISVDAALAYYESRGQNWERAAWIKARPCAGDVALGERFLGDLAPFIWRKHLDFATIADIQAMKRQINMAKHVGGIRVEGHNVKLGIGGIREIEFFTQTQQLIAGGRDPALRVRPTCDALAALCTAGWIDASARDVLTKTYWFLRAVENRVQMRRDEQTHVLPESDEGIDALAGVLGHTGAGFRTAYIGALNTVTDHYGLLFSEGESLAAVEGNLVFTGSDDDPGTLETLSRMGFKDAKRAMQTVKKWHYGSYAATRTSAARAHLTELLPGMLLTLSQAGNPDEALLRFDRFLSRLPAGVQLFSMLRNNPSLRSLLVSLMAAAPRMAEAVIQRAHVMDAFIDPAFGDEVHSSELLRQRIDAFFADAIDYQDVIDRARIIGQEMMFLISAGLLSGTIAADRAGEQFTTLAEALLGRLFDAARGEFEQRHGRVPEARVALLAFGKMAAREMTARSDLDFILLYDAPANAESDGTKPLAASQYFARLTQRLLAALSAPTSEGVLYEADMRLRPSGNAGPLATGLRGFVQYHNEQSWTWERMALSRARVVYAEAGFDAEIGALLEEILLRPRDADKVIGDVVDMRARMTRDRAPRHAYDLKLAAGGLIDIEFMAQSAQLVASARLASPQAPTRRVLERMAETGLLPKAARLAEIHALYATVLQVMSAALANPFKDDGWTDGFRELLAQRTNRPTFERLSEDLHRMQDEVGAIAADWYERARQD